MFAILSLEVNTEQRELADWKGGEKPLIVPIHTIYTPYTIYTIYTLENLVAHEDLGASLRRSQDTTEHPKHTAEPTAPQLPTTYPKGVASQLIVQLHNSGSLNQ